MDGRRQKVAVIGAGVSGLTAAKHLRGFDLEVTVLERSSHVGGVWRFDERRPPEPKYPSVIPSQSDFQSSSSSQVILESVPPDADLEHAPPGPAYESLTNNIPTSLIELQGHPWQDQTGDYVSHKVIWEYIRDYVILNALQPLIRFNTRVEKVDKHGQTWKVQSGTLVRYPGNGVVIHHKTEIYDAVVVASGHYHAPRIPDLPGLHAWKQRWPGRIFHSKSFRKVADVGSHNLLLIGAGVSSTDIANAASPFVDRIFQVSRGSTTDIPVQFLPKNAERVASISSFGSLSESNPDPTLTRDMPIPATIMLNDGRVLKNIHTVILCTGYLITYPFLAQYHDDFTPVEQANDKVLVTNGTQLHNLHEDIFYIPDPTLAFVGTSFSVASFSLYEFQSVAIAAVFSGHVKVPSTESMRRQYRERLAKKGPGKLFHSLRNDEVEYVSRLVSWLNIGLAVSPGRTVQGHSAKWLQKYENRREWLAGIFNKAISKL